MSYRVVAPWSLENRRDVGGSEVTLEWADLIDSHGVVFREGAWRVRVDGKIRRTFKGETAWSDSHRLFSDVCYGLALTR